MPRQQCAQKCRWRRSHDAHGLGWDAGVRMDLLQHLVRVLGVALLAAAVVLLAGLLLGLGHSFFRALFRGRSRLSWFRHVYNDNTQQHRKILKIPKAIFVSKLVWLNRRAAEGRKGEGSVEGRKERRKKWHICHLHCCWFTCRMHSGNADSTLVDVTALHNLYLEQPMLMKGLPRWLSC